MNTQEVEADVDVVLRQLPRFDNPYNKKLLAAGCFAMGKLAVDVFEAIQHTLRTNDALALQAFYKVHSGFAGVTANEQLLKAAAAAVTQPSVENILEALERIAQQGQLVTNDEYTEAFSGFFRAHPEYAYPGIQGGDANFSILNAALRGEPVTLENLELLLDLGNPNYIGDRLVLNSAWEQAQEEQRERHTLIQQISQGRSTYTSRRPYDGKVEEWKTAELHEETTERLQEIAAFLNRQRGELKMTKDELKAKNKVADEERLRQMMNNYPRLPATLGGVTMDAAYLKQLANHDRGSAELEEFRRIWKLYGDQQVTDRLNGRN